LPQTAARKRMNAPALETRHLGYEIRHENYYDDSGREAQALKLVSAVFAGQDTADDRE